MKIIHNKLVRDSIPEIIKSNGKSPKIKTLTKDDFIIELKNKLIEESNELKSAKSNIEVINEIVDILEIVDSIVLFYKIDRKEINLQKILKKKKRGGFAKKIYLEYEE